MEHGIRREETHFPSTNGRTQVHAVLWWPDCEPKAVVQLVHGMAEYILRYDAFARFLCSCGFAVCGHDHVGHGASVADKSELSRLPVHGGRDILVGDVGRMRGLMRERVDAGCPYFLFGHSMGSFVVRAYISECAQGLAGAIICGTGYIPPAICTAGKGLAHLIARLRGEDHVSSLLQMVTTGGYSKAMPDARTPLDWLSHSEAIVDSYIEDDLCGRPFSAGANAALMALTGEACSRSCFSRVPNDLPLLFVAGAEDPVGSRGKGVRRVVRMATEAGSTDVTCIVYDHMRHEILAGDGSDRVLDSIRTWMEERI